MRGIAAFSHMLPDTVTYETRSGTDKYGDPTWNAAATYKARVVGEQKLIRSFAGLEVVSGHTVYLAGQITAQPTDRITLSTSIVASTQDTAIHPPILGAKRIPDQSGVHHTVLHLG